MEIPILGSSVKFNPLYRNLWLSIRSVAQNKKCQAAFRPDYRVNLLGYFAFLLHTSLDGYCYFQFSLGTREARRMRAVLCCREKGFGVVKKAGELSSVLGWGGVGVMSSVGMTQFLPWALSWRTDSGEAAALNLSGKGRRDEESFEQWGTFLPLLPISSNPKSHDSEPSQLKRPIREEEEEDGGGESLAQPGIMSPSRNSTFLPSLFQSFCGSSWKQVRDPHASFPCLHKNIDWIVAASEGGRRSNETGSPKRDSEGERSISITLKILLFASLVSLRWTHGVESGSPEGSHRIRFFFICKNESYLPIKDEHLSNNTFNLKTENLSSGQIICTCKFAFRKFEETPWGQLYSPESNQLVFSVVGVPPSPLLKVDPLTQRVKKGDPLVFLCSTEGGITEKKFHFYKDGVEITSSEESLLEPATESTNPLQNASLRIPHASFNHSGEFACSYEEKRSNQWIMSSLSQGVNITVEPVSPQDSDPIWRYYRVAITIIILLVPFSFYCWTKKSEFPSKEQSQLAEKKKERGDLGMMEPPAATAASASPVKDSEATYCNIQDSFTPSSPGPTRENRLTQEKTGETLEASRMRAVLCCREKGFGVVKKAGEPSSVLGWGGVVGGLTQEKLQLFISLGKEEESDRSQDHLPRNPEEKMETISWMTGLGLVSSSISHLNPTLLLPEGMIALFPPSHLLQPIREEEEDVGDESLAQPGIMSPSRNSTFLPSLFQSFRGSSSKQVRDPHAPLPCLHKKHRLGLLRPLKEGEGPMKPEARREIQKEKGPSLWITLKFLLFMSLVNLRWTHVKTSPPNIKWRRGVESGSPEGSHRIRFFFICKNESYLPIQDHHLSNNTFNVKTENLSSGQIICTCKFTFRKFEETPWGQLYSPESNQLVFSVVGVPPSPLLKVDLLNQRVKESDSLVFLCSTEEGTTEKKFHFYKDGVEITSSEEGLLEPSTEPTNPLQNSSLRIPHASFNHSGEFACSYEEKKQWIMSSLSQGVNITVEPDSDAIWRYFWVAITIIILLVLFAFYCWTKKSSVPPSPLLRVDPLSQRVKEGDPLVFLCSTEKGDREKKFHFYKDGVEITSIEESLLEPSTEPTNPLLKASLRIPHASFNHSGEFACNYEEKRRNRWILSSLSQGVNIMVEPASVSQEQFHLREKKEERNDLPVMEPPAATAATSSSVKDSEVTYSCIQNFLTPSPAGPTRKNCLTQREEEGILYSDIVFPPKRRQQNHP
ncbi:hypothetical protein E2320_003636, partial [Naja naja]